MIEYFHLLRSISENIDTLAKIPFIGNIPVWGRLSFKVGLAVLSVAICEEEVTLEASVSFLDMLYFFIGSLGFLCES